MTTRFVSLALASAAALALTACGSGDDAVPAAGGQAADPIAAVAAPAGTTWSQTVTATPDGFVMGNPDAPLKLVEFGSFTCSHCAEFSAASHEPLKRDFIDTGRVSFELRPFVRDPLDLMLATTAVCAGAERFFPLSEAIFAAQNELIGGAQAAPNAAQTIANLPEAERFPSLARAWGLDRFFAARGLTAADVNRCLADTAALEAREASARRNGEQYEIAGTPSFLLNGTLLQNVGTWEQLRERLQAAGAR